MEKKKRTKKPVNISIDTKNIDIEIKRDENGLKVDLDTPILDATLVKNDQGLNIDIDINDKDIYNFESNGTSKHLIKGHVYRITGERLKLFLKRGFGKLIN
jgi:hypothetical protein